MIDLTARIKEHLAGNPDCQSAKVRRTSWGQTNEYRQYSRTTSTSINLRLPALPSVFVPFRWTAIMSGPLALQYIGMKVQNDDS